MVRDPFLPVHHLRVVLILLVFLFSLGPVLAEGLKGRVTGYDIPRFVSLAASEANMRVGPGLRYDIAWIYRAQGLPLEIIEEFDTWRQVRDQSGTVGWLHGTLLSGTRTGTAVAGPERPHVTLRTGASSDHPARARLEPGVRLHLQACDGTWCRVRVPHHAVWGHVRQERIWGVYPGEVFE